MPFHAVRMQEEDRNGAFLINIKYRYIGYTEHKEKEEDDYGRIRRQY